MNQVQKYRRNKTVKKYKKLNLKSSLVIIIDTYRCITRLD